MFTGILLKKLSHLKEQIKTNKHPLYEQIHSSLIKLNDTSLKSYLWQPEVSHRLLNFTHFETADLVSFLYLTLSAETAKFTHTFEHK
jgi:hypothetical protein